MFYNLTDRNGESFMIKTISEITQLWNRVLQKIETRLDDKMIYNSFFEGSYINEIQGDTLIIYVNSPVAKILMRTKYSDIIQEAVNEVTESNFKVDFIAAEDIESSSDEDKPSEKKKVEYFKDSKLNPKLTFDTFVVGQFNREASQASLVVAQNPGKMFNPLFIYSNSGLGKTHLLHSIGNHIIKNGNPNYKILYVNGQTFVDEFVGFVKGDKGSESLNNFFKTVDVLLFDDVQLLKDKKQTQEMLFYVYNYMIEHEKQIVITSDKQPAELDGLEDRLVTRFSQGLTVKIGEPDEFTCTEILKKKIVENGLDINTFDDDVISFFASRFSKNVRELEGALSRLIFKAITIKQSSHITMDVASEAVSDLVGGKALASQLNEQKIINIVADYYNLLPSQLTGKIRTGQIALARHIAMYLIRDTLDVSLKKIGDMFGGKDHTTVMNALTKVENGLKTDEKLKQAVNELKTKIKS